MLVSFGDGLFSGATLVSGRVPDRLISLIVSHDLNCWTANMNQTIKRIEAWFPFQVSKCGDRTLMDNFVHFEGVR